jgi:tetratricopeptide (TPR) repeat protein
MAQGDAMWEQRTSAENVRAALSHWERAAQAEPRNLDLLVKLTRGHYFLADGYLRDNEREYLAMMDQGVEWGEKAMIAASPEFEKLMRDGTKYPKAVQAVPREGVPAMYWYASALGKWAKRKGFAVLLGQKDNVKATMDRALALHPEYYHGGPPRYFGAFYAIAPAFAGGDLEKSKASFERSLQIEPNFVGTKVLWAAELAVKVQDEETFDRLLAEVLATPDDIIPEVRPETIVEKQKAKELLAQKSDLF